MKIVVAIFEKMKILNLFLMWTTLNFEDRSKTKKRTGDIYKRTPDIEFEQDSSVGLGATLDDGQKIKNYFSSFRDFREKPIVSKFNQIRGSHFWKNRNLKSFSYVNCP